MPLITFKRFAVFFLVIGALTMRPALFGEVATKYSLMVLGSTLIFSLVFMRLNLCKEAFNRNILLALGISIFWSYLSIHATILGIGATELDNVLKAALSTTIIVFVYAITLADSSIRLFFFRMLAWIFVFEIISYIITMLLLYGGGLETQQISMFHVETVYQDVAGWLMLPFTFTYGTMSLGGFTLYRLGGPFREAGIFQAFIIWAYFSLAELRMNYWWVKLTLLMGLILTMSTAGIAVFFSCYLLSIVLSGQISSAIMMRRFVTTAIGAAFSVLLFFYMPVFGLLDKMENREGSFSDRMRASIDGFQIFINHPLGSGMYNASFELVGVNFIGATSEIGIIGVMLILTIIGYALFSVHGRQNRREYFLKIFPFLITGLTAQPFLDAPLIFVMLMQYDFKGSQTAKIAGAVDIFDGK